MAGLHLSRKSGEIFDPDAGSTYVALHAFVWIVALAAKFHSVDNRIPLLTKIFSERPEITGSTTQSVHADENA